MNSIWIIYLCQIYFFSCTTLNDDNRYEIIRIEPPTTEFILHFSIRPDAEDSTTKCKHYLMYYFYVVCNDFHYNLGEEVDTIIKVNRRRAVLVIFDTT